MKKSSEPANDRSAKPRGIQRRKPQLMALEPRFMFDGAAVTTAVAAGALPDALHHADAGARTADLPAPAALEQADAGATPAYAAATAQSTPSARNEVVFIDTTVTNWQDLAADTKSGASVVLLDPTRDALQQIAQALQGKQGVDAIHIVSHGTDGTLVIGSSIYDSANLSAHQADLAAIGGALGPDGDILLYGCDVGAGTTGSTFMGALSRATGADVAASTDTTGAASPWGGNWALEKRTGPVESGLFADAQTLANYTGELSTIDLSGKSGWVAIMYGTAQDPQGDSQAKAADTDIVADPTHGSLYTSYEDAGTTSTADDYVGFRLRIDNPTSSTDFDGVAVIGIDATGDGRIDLFIQIDARSNDQVIRLLDPGTDLNNSPSTTSFTPLPPGWIPSNGVYAMNAGNYNITAVTDTTDPHWNGDNDLGNDGKADVFVSVRIPMADLAAVMAIPSPVDGSGNYGPRGADGITFTKDTHVRYVSFTQTQPNTINADLNGVGAHPDKNATWEDLGAMTDDMTPSNPVSKSSYVHIQRPVDANGVLNATEDDAFAVSGTATPDGWVKVHISDGTHTVDVWKHADGVTGAWAITPQDVSTFNEARTTSPSRRRSWQGMEIRPSSTDPRGIRPPSRTTRRLRWSG
jgi:hypothetical protein